jgi:RNA polymerase sigma-70 factor (ECF subfamily)
LAHGLTSTVGLGLPAGNSAALADADDVALVVAARRDRCQFRLLYERYADRLFRYARARSGSASLADDIVYETLSTALEDLGRFDAGRGSFAGWLFAIAGCCIADHDRQRRPLERLGAWLGRHGPLGDDALDALLPESDARTVRALLERLSTSDRELLLLRYSAGLTCAEIGDALGISEDVARARLTRLHERLSAEAATGALQ